MRLFDRFRKPRPTPESQLFPSHLLELFEHAQKSGQSLESKVAELCESFERRAYAEAVYETFARGVVESLRNGKTHLKPAVRQAFLAEPALAAELRAYYSEEQGKGSDHQLFTRIEKRFGDRIIEKVAIPLKVPAAQCLVAAIHFCREPIE